MEVSVKQVQGTTLVSKGPSNHWMVMDSIEKFQGADAASRPMEMVLMALGGCSAMDVISLLNKMRVKLRDFKISLKAERSEEHPKVFTRIHLKYYFYGNELKEDKIKKAVQLSQEKYCSVTAMLKATVDISYDIHLEH